MPNCEFCTAIKFPGGGLDFCCRHGKVNIFIPDVPNELRRLFTSQTDKDALYFRQNIRYFNSHFSFTSFGASVDRRVATAAGNVAFLLTFHDLILFYALLQINFFLLLPLSQVLVSIHQGSWSNLPQIRSTKAWWEGTSAYATLFLRPRRYHDT